MADGAAAAREPFHTRVAGWLEHAFNPIMVKELRASMRGARFFVAHLTILSLFATGLLLTFAVTMAGQGGRYDEGAFHVGDPSRVGRAVYLITQLIHLGVVFLVVPGLAATSITSERDGLTYDLLLSTTLDARQIVWGKFTAAMTQTFTIFVSMVPLVGLCFLFGGITVYQILANYAFLFGLSALMIAFALSISANARSTQRAVGTVYGLAMVAGFIAGVLAWGAGRQGILTAAAMAYGFLSPGDDAGGGSAPTMFERIMYVHVMPGLAWAALLSLFFINASNRLKPAFANRSTNLRIYYAAVLFGAGALTVATFYHELPVTTSPGDRNVALMAYTIASLTASLMCALFACEDPIPPPHLAGRRRAAALGFLRPGSASGSVYSLVVNGLFLVVSFAAFVPYTAGFSRGAWKELPPAYPSAVAFVSAYLWTYFTAMFARWLAAAMPGRPVLLRTILVIVCLFLAVFPIVHCTIASQIERDEEDPSGKHGPVTLGLSPAAAILSALDLSSLRRDFPLFAARLPVPALFALFAAAAGTAFLVLALRAESRLRADYARLKDLKHFE